MGGTVTREYKDLAITFNAKLWDSMLEKAKTAPTGFFTEYEQQFVDSMIQHNSEDRPLWNPSLRQWNYLHTLVSKL